MVSMHYGISSPVLTVQYSSGIDFFSPESEMTMPCPYGRASHRRSSPAVISTPPSQNFLAKSHFPVAGRKRRADDADLEEPDSRSSGNQCSRANTRNIRSIRKVASVGRQIAPEATDASLEQLRQYLGISWKALPPSQAQASNGWVKYIENHFPIGSATILLYNVAWKAYFVRAVSDGISGPSEQFYLFQESLMAARLVSNSLPIAVQKISHWSQMLTHGSSWSPLNDVDSLVYATHSRLNQQAQISLPAQPMEIDVEMS